MNEDNIQLPGFLIADLYRHSIVLAGDEPKTERKQPKKDVPAAERQWYLGSNLQKITLLVSEKEAVYLQDDSLQFLSNILGACKLNLGDVAIVNHHNDPVDYTFLKEKLSPAFLLLFGVTAQEIQLPFSVPYYQVQKYDGRQFLLGPSLDKMLGDSQESKLEKSKLWLSLKKMFNI
ncbi:MAG: hypothetical protein V4557_17800 [Bacteroidota bacterium]